MDTRLLYTALVFVVALGRLGELRIANRNVRRLLARGGVEAGVEHYRWMVLLHTLFLAACPLEVWWLNRPFTPALAAGMLVLLLLAASLRWWVISSLEGRWTTRIVVLPGVPPVTRGPYRFLRHPNYLAVVVEILALPLVHTAWLTALVFSLGNLVMLRVRIRAEEAALAWASEDQAAFSGRPRLVPGAR